MANEILEKIYNGETNKEAAAPEYIYHYIGGTYFDDDKIDIIKEHGFESKNNPNRWAELNEFIPNRPIGVFFWGPEMEDIKADIWHLRVPVSKLDTDKLFAFPSALAMAADAAAMGKELVNGAVEAMKLAHAVPYAEYGGEFAAEWIYTGDISPEDIEWK